jgi:enoyl-CoA hydratase/carnithine racemase
MTGPGDDSAVLAEVADGVLTITVNRPQARNALRVEDKRRITGLMSRARGPEVRCVLLTGAGEKAFCAGSDLKEMSAMDGASFLEMQEAESAMYDAIMRCPMPLFAAVRGWALGTGCVLTAVCDLVFADPAAKFGQPEILNGAPTPIHGALLPRVIGLSRARWLVLTGRTIDATTAERWGLVNQVSAPGAVLATARELAVELARTVHPSSMALQKRIIDSWVRYPFDAAVMSSMYVAASAYGSGWPQSAADRMHGRSLLGSEGVTGP